MTIKFNIKLLNLSLAQWSQNLCTLSYKIKNLCNVLFSHSVYCKVFQKKTAMTLFFLLFICNSRISSISFKFYFKQPKIKFVHSKKIFIHTSVHLKDHWSSSTRETSICSLEKYFITVYVC